MKRLLPLAFALFLVGCKGPQGPAGPIGNQGNPGTGLQTFTITFRNGVSPTTSYSGTSMNRVESGTANTSYAFDGTLLVKSSTADISRVLIRFDLLNWIPSNATITGAALELVTDTSTSLGSTTTVGVHNMSIPVMVDTGSCIWNPSATWNAYGPTFWSACSGPGAFTPVYNYDATPIDTVSCTTALNGTNTRLAWNITPAIVQKWVATPAKNNGLVLTSENEGANTAGSIVFVAQNNPAWPNLPNLVVTYYVP